MKERPILFSGHMVRALLDGSKTQTRRAVKNTPLDWLEMYGFTPEFVANSGNGMCPYGQPGDRLWVRESFAHIYRDNSSPERRSFEDVAYMADGRGIDIGAYGSWKPSIHMPRWASRILLEITRVRVERLQDISEADCIAEGCKGGHGSIPGYQYSAAPREQYFSLWESINGDRSWEANPWVWVIEFQRVQL